MSASAGCGHWSALGIRWSSCPILLSPAVEVILSRTGAKSRTRGRKLHLTGAKARLVRTRPTRADLEQQLKACRQEIAHARERLAEATKQQTATSEMLRLISN